MLDPELTPLLGAILTTSFLGSLHCVGMCGPLVASSVCNGSRAAVAAGQLLYHLGRLSTLALVGAGCGAIGAGISDLGALLGLQRAAALLGGVLLGLWGLALLWRGGESFHIKLPGGIGARVGTWLRAAGRLPLGRRALLLGALTPLLPCGWLYLFLIPAAASGSALKGSLVLVTFGLGNLPALFGVALSFREALAQARARLRQVSALLLIATGMLLVVQRGSLELPLPPATASAPANATPPAPNLPQVGDQARLPCCGGASTAPAGSGS